MDNIDFIFNSKDKSILSKEAKIFYYVFGMFLVITSLIGIYRFIEQNSFDISFYSMSLIFLVGVLWIILGLTGRSFMLARKYISFSNDSIYLKKAFKNEIRLPHESMVLITIKPSILNIKTKDIIVDFDLTWINFNELQQLKKRIAEFGSLNKIEIK